jgi:tRNA A37 threonylcarbamoyladenosine biosynthesis protein TsaE
MHRIEIIQSLYEATCLNRRTGNPNLILSPIYYSIYSNGKIRSTEDIVQSVNGNPVYVCCFIKMPRQHFNGFPYTNLEHFAYVTEDGKSSNELVFNKWELTEVTFNNNNEVVNSITMNLLNTYPKELCCHFGNYNLNNEKQITFADLWQFINEIDESCKTVAEANFYFKYFLESKRSDALELNLKEYQEAHSKETDMNFKYRDLLKTINNLVSGI